MDSKTEIVIVDKHTERDNSLYRDSSHRDNSPYRETAHYMTYGVCKAHVGDMHDQ